MLRDEFDDIESTRRDMNARINSLPVMKSVGCVHMLAVTMGQVGANISDVFSSVSKSFGLIGYEKIYSSDVDPSTVLQGKEDLNEQLKLQATAF
jgi:hypothetical protein